MRFVSTLIALSALGFAGSAAAQSVSLAPISFSQEFQASLTNDLGVREGDFLRERVEHAVTAALVRRGASVQSGAPITVEISIVDADPNRPTMLQLNRRPYIDFNGSYSVGGAELVAVLRGADGQVIQEVRHRRYSYDINELAGPPATWTDADRAIDQFANKVADAYLAHAS